MIRLFCVLLLSLLFQIHAEEDFSAQIELSSSSIMPNQHLTVSLTLRHPDTFHVDFDMLRSQLIDRHDHSPFALVFEDTSPQRKSDQNTLTQNITYTLEAWEPGTYPLSFLSITFLPNDPSATSPVTLFPEVFAVEVQLPPPIDNSDLTTAPLLSLAEQPDIEITPENRRELLENETIQTQEAKRNKETFHRKAFPWKPVLIALALLIVIASFRKILKRYLKSAYYEAFTTDPRAKALKALDKLQQQNLPSQGLFDEFYVAVTAIIRIYIEDKYSLHAPEQTTEEFLQEVRQHPIFDTVTQSQLTEFLTSADLVKFARHRPKVDDCRGATSAAAHFIEA